MKKFALHLLGITAVFSTGINKAEAQDPAITLDTNKVISIINKKADAKKTLTSLEIFSRLYQISLSDVTADDKSIGFKSTIFGLHKIFDPSIDESPSYKSLWIERRIEPFLKFAYRDNFKTVNSTLGVNISILNANDKTESKLINNDPVVLADIIVFGSKLSVYSSKLSAVLSTGTDSEKKVAADRMAAFESFVRTNKIDELPAVVKSDLENIFVTGNGGQETLFQAIIRYNQFIDILIRKVDNAWNVVFSPQFSYAYNKSELQGYSFTANAIKGFNAFKKQATQIKLKSALIIGSDTIITNIDRDRRLFRNEVGINQVLFTKELKNEAGEAENSPAGEFTLSGGYDYVYRGTTADEKRGQPTLGAKFGFLVGKESWLVFPFTYNFETNKGFASISIKVNLGESPIKR